MQAGGSPGIAAVLPAVGSPALPQQSSAVASPGGTSWREPIFPQTGEQSSLLPFPRGCSAQPLVCSTTWWHPSALSPAQTSSHAETILSAGSGSSWPVPSPTFAEHPCALRLPKSPSAFSLPFTGCLNLH